MATGSGFDSQVGYVAEGTPGTYQAPTRHLEHVSSGLKEEIDRIAGRGIKAGRRHNGRWYPGGQRVKGPVSHELSPIGSGILLKHGMGAVNTSGSGPYTHVYTFGALTQTSTMTVQVGTPSVNGTVNPLSFIGCHVTGFNISCKAGEAAMITPQFFGQHLDVSQSLVSAAYPSTWAPFTFLHGVLSLAGSEYEFDDVSLDVDNGLKVDRHTHRSTTPARPRLSLESGHRTAKAVINSEFYDMTVLNRAIAGTEVAFSLVFTSGANSLTIAGNVRTDMDSPTIDGVDVTKQGIPLEFLSTTSDPAALTITQVTTESAP